MRPQQRSFVVEIKSARRRLKTEPKSIWGNTDFKALVRDAEAVLPYMHNATPETPVHRQDDLPAKSEEQSVIVSSPSNHDVHMRVAPSEQEEVQLPQPAAVRESGQPENSKTDKTVSAQPKLSRHWRRPKAVVDDVALDDSQLHVRKSTSSDELALLEDENRRLKALLVTHLHRQNAELTRMLARFESH